MIFKKFEDIDTYGDEVKRRMKAYEEEDGPVTKDELRDRYDRALEQLVSELSQSFDLKESADDCDLSYYSYVPPSREIVLVVVNLHLDGSLLVRIVYEVLDRLPLRLLVSLDGLGYVTITRNGEILGYSEHSDLSEYGF